MATALVQKRGEAVAFMLPEAHLEQTGLTPSSTVSWEIDRGPSHIAPQPACYDVAELLAQCDPSAPLLVLISEWTSSGPAGNELI